MIKKLIFILFFGVLSSHSQSTSSDLIASSPFQEGEWFQLRIHYGLLNASYATLSLDRDTINGNPVFHAKAFGETSGIARWFFKVEDYYESYFDQTTILPYKFIRDINEGGYTKSIEIDFNHELKKAKVNNKIKRLIKGQRFY